MTTPASAKSHDRFPDTRWSLVVAASEPDSPASRRAFAELCQIYWFPIYSYIRNRGKSPEDAEDLTQEFFATLIERETLRAADAERGKLRAYLLGSVKRFIVSAHRKESAQKRGGGKKPISFDTAMAEMLFSDKPVAAGTPEEIFEQTWA
ncbi:MAG: sigma factor, partial [Verrucomicrobiales bacterium]